MYTRDGDFRCDFITNVLNAESNGVLRCKISSQITGNLECVVTPSLLMMTPKSSVRMHIGRACVAHLSDIKPTLCTL